MDFNDLKQMGILLSKEQQKMVTGGVAEDPNDCDKAPGTICVTAADCCPYFKCVNTEYGDDYCEDMR